MLPGIGEHTVEVLGELGFDGEVIQQLLDDGVARQLAPLSSTPQQSNQGSTT